MDLAFKIGVEKYHLDVVVILTCCLHRNMHACSPCTIFCRHVVLSMSVGSVWEALINKVHGKGVSADIFTCKDFIVSINVRFSSRRVATSSCAAFK